MKRVFDIFVVLISLLLLIPIYLLVILVVKIKLSSPIFFKQSRPGLKGKAFNIHKFRTMTNECN
jgi:sugar transferase EpsL